MGDILIGNTPLSKIYRGQTELSKVYRGQTEIWTSSPLPTWAQNYNIFYSANASSTFIDKSDSGNDGTINGTISYTSGATPYWDFTSTNYVNTGLTPGVINRGTGPGVGDSTPFSIVLLYQAKSTSATSNMFYAFDDPGDKLTVHTNTSTAVAELDGTPTDETINITGITTDTWYLLMVVKDDDYGNYYEAYLNNVFNADSGDNPTDMNISNQIRIGSNIDSTNNFRLAAFGWAKGHFADATERTDIYNYYNSIYSL